VTIEKELGPLVMVGVECKVKERMVARGRLMLSRQLGSATQKEDSQQ
jgi:hypothetical protein